MKCIATIIIANLLQVFPSPADGVHLPPHLPLLLVGQHGAEGPRVGAAVPGASNLNPTETCQRRVDVTLKMLDEKQRTHLSSCAVVTPLDVQLEKTI